jgi:hypothetical protein
MVFTPFIKLNMLFEPAFPKQSQMRLMGLSLTLKNVIFRNKSTNEKAQYDWLLRGQFRLS